MRGDVNARFDAKVDKSGDCWIWTGAKCDGYGVFRLSGPKKENIRAHRFAYEREHGKLLPGLHLCHKCDNPSCVRPEHLFVGTNYDNIADSMMKGRRKGVPRKKWGPDHPQRINPDLVLRGESHGMTHLTEQSIRDIRAADISRYGDLIKLARQFGVSDATILRIRKRAVWRHVA